MTTAIYYQKSEVVQEEFKLIEVATLREMVVEKLQRVIREVKERRRECDDAAILETMTLFNKVRDATVEIIRSISIWQESFTKPIRPRILDCDYIIDRLIYHIDFINSSNLKRLFNFQFYRGNFLLLPYPNPKTVEPVRISTALAREIRAFAAPPEETVIYCYQFMINCLPDDVYANKVAPLKRWLMAGWIPRVWVVDVKPTPVAPKQAIKRHVLASATAPTGSRRSSTTAAASDEGKNSQRNGAGAEVTTADATVSAPTTPGGGSPSPNSRLLRRRSTLGSSNSGHSGGKKGKEEAEQGNNKTRIKRRNQMKEEETAQLKAIVVDTGAGSPTAAGSSGADLQALQWEEYLRAEQEKKEKEMSRLDTYFQEMELLFVPTLGRRAVQTVLVGGTRTDDNKEYHEPVTHDLFHQPDKIVFHHSTTTQEEMDHMQGVLADKTIPEDSNRVNAALVTKRNRIMADRGQPTRDRTYEKHQQNVDFSSYKRKFDRSKLLNSKMEVNPMEILFAVSDPESTKVQDKVSQAESEKIAAAYLKNKYNTGQLRARSKDTRTDSGDGSAEARSQSKKTGRRPSGVTVDSGSGKSVALDDASETSRSEKTDKTPLAGTEASREDIPPPPAESPFTNASLPSVSTTSQKGNVSASAKLPPVQRPAAAKTLSLKSPAAMSSSAKSASASSKTLKPLTGRTVSGKGSAKDPRRPTEPTSPKSPASEKSGGGTPASGSPSKGDGEDTVGFEAEAAVTPSTPGAGGAAEDRELSESRRFRRRDSRRMSDLTVTFSVGDGEYGGTSTAGDGYEVVEEVQPPIGGYGATNHFPAAAIDTPERNASPSQRGGSKQGRRHPSPGRIAGSPQRSPHKANRPPNVNTRSPAKSHANSSTHSRTGTPTGASETRSRTSTVRNDGTNEYGIKIKAGTPPKASLSLTLSTEAMRLMFARAEEADVGSVTTQDT